MRSGIAFKRPDDFNKAIEYLNIVLGDVKEMGEKVLEEKTYSYLARAYAGLSDYKKAVVNYNLLLSAAKSLGASLRKEMRMQVLVTLCYALVISKSPWIITNVP